MEKWQILPKATSGIATQQLGMMAIKCVVFVVCSRVERCGHFIVIFIQQLGNEYPHCCYDKSSLGRSSLGRSREFH